MISKSHFRLVSYFVQQWYVGKTSDIPDKGKEPVLNWTARIVNVKSIAESPKETPSSSYLLTTIILWGWDAYWFIFLSIALFTLTILLSSYSNRIKVSGKRQYVLFALFMLIGLIGQAAAALPAAVGTTRRRTDYGRAGCRRRALCHHRHG